MGVQVRPGAPNPLHLNNNLFNKRFPSYFLKVFFALAQWKKLLLKNGTVNSWTLFTSMLLLEQDLHCVGLLVLWDFCNISLPNIGENQINVLQFERMAPGTVPYYGKSDPGYCIMFTQKVR